jgi:hypothetical protein
VVVQEQQNPSPYVDIIPNFLNVSRGEVVSVEFVVSNSGPGSMAFGILLTLSSSSFLDLITIFSYRSRTNLGDYHVCINYLPATVDATWPFPQNFSCSASVSCELVNSSLLVNYTSLVPANTSFSFVVSGAPHCSLPGKK